MTRMRPCAPRSRARAGPSLRKDADAGYVTAETAAVLPALAVVAVALLWVLAAGAAHIRCLDAARTAAREVARGEPDSRVAADVRAAAPRDADILITPEGGLVRAIVRVRLALPGPLGRYGGAVSVAASAVAEAESALARPGPCPPPTATARPPAPTGAPMPSPSPAGSSRAAGSAPPRPPSVAPITPPGGPRPRPTSSRTGP